MSDASSADYDALVLPGGQIKRAVGCDGQPACNGEDTGIQPAVDLPPREAFQKVPADLYRYRCLRARLPNNALFRWRFERDGVPVQIDVQGALTLDEASLVRIAAREGMGLGYVQEADVREDIASGRLVRVLKDWSPSLAPLALYYPGRKNPPAAFSAFIQAA